MIRFVFCSVFVLLAVVICMSCQEDVDNDISESPNIQGLTLDNYPKVDGSTSSLPLNVIVACRLLGIDYKWESIFNAFAIGTREVIPQISGTSINKFNERVKSSQTHYSFINLIDKKTDLILSARKISQDELAHAVAAGVSLIETPIALDAFIFIINPDNAIRSLTTRQIQDIYTGKINHWDEVGGEGVGQYSEYYGPITPYVREANSGSQELMELLVMKDLEIGEFESNKFEILFSMAGPLDKVMSEINAICYTLYYYKEQISLSSSSVKTIDIDGIYPNVKTISNNSYPFVAEVYAVIRSDLDKSSMAYKVYKWLQTEVGQQTVSESGYVPYY